MALIWKLLKLTAIAIALLVVGLIGLVVVFAWEAENQELVIVTKQELLDEFPYVAPIIAKFEAETVAKAYMARSPFVPDYVGFSTDQRLAEINSSPLLCERLSKVEDTFVGNGAFSEEKRQFFRLEYANSDQNPSCVASLASEPLSKTSKLVVDGSKPRTSGEIFTLSGEKIIGKPTCDSPKFAVPIINAAGALLQFELRSNAECAWNYNPSFAIDGPGAYGVRTTTTFYYNFVLELGAYYD
ncbi:MAG: hypothetical protein AAGA12_06840 [Pseudomonadota bacterium]